MQRGWIDRPHRATSLGDFKLDSGERIRSLEVSFVSHGELAPDRDNAVLLLPAIHSTHHRLDHLIGPNQAIDPRRWFVLCVDPIGNGLTTSPSTSAHQPLLDFPRFTIRDMVRCQARLLTEEFGLSRLACVIGASMGGMQALQWGVSFPDLVGSIVAMTPMARTSAWTRLVNAAYCRSLIQDDLWWRREPSEVDWRGWVMVQMMAGQTPRSIERQVRSELNSAHMLSIDRVIAERAKWLSLQGSHPVDRVYQIWAYDAHDIGLHDGFDGDTQAALASIRAPTLILSPPLDLYNPSDEARRIAACMPKARFETIWTDTGHQSTTELRREDSEFVNRRVRAFLEEFDGGWV